MLNWVVESLTVGRCDRNYLHDATAAVVWIVGLGAVVLLCAAVSIWWERRKA